VQLVSPHIEGRRDEVANAVGWRQRKGTPAVAELVAEAIGHQEKDVAEAELQEGFRRVAMTPRIGFPFPELPGAMIDCRRMARAVETEPGNPAAQESLFGGERVVWYHANPRGAPCFPGSFEDVSPRTVDLRTPDWRRGHFHPRRVLLFVPPPVGFFAPGSECPTWPGASSEEVHEISNQNFKGTIHLDSGSLVLRNVAAEKVVLAASSSVFLDARNCLLDEVVVEKGTVQMEYCTVMKKLTCKRLKASDCILPDDVGDNMVGCVRYSRVPQKLLDRPDHLLLRHRPGMTTDLPVFFGYKTCGAAGDASEFGNPGYGVLHPAAPDSICHGAEDGGEMGAFHHKHYCLQHAAVLDKLKDFLPLGIEAVLIPDPRLLPRPPKETNNHETGVNP